ncbi:MAG: ectoine hydroxylase [Myxococcota bacterium]
MSVGEAYRTRVRSAEPSRRRREPVLWSSAGPDAPLDADQQRQFAEKGYLVLAAAFSPEEVAALRDEADRLREESATLEPESLVREPKSETVRSVFAVHRQSRVFRELAADRRVADVARFLLDDDVYIHQSRLNYKLGFDGEPFHWHSDFETWHAEDGMPLMRAVSASILLDVNTACNGPLMVIPGSHLRFFPCVGETPDAHYRDSLKHQRYGVPDPGLLEELARSNGIEALEGEAGSVVLFDCNLMHASAGNITPLPRSNVFLVYNALSNRVGPPPGGLRPRPEFLATRGRVEPIGRR